LEEILKILENQKEVKYLTYFIVQDKLKVIKLKLGTVNINKQYKFQDESACLNKIIDIILELKRLEKWALGRLEKNNGSTNYNRRRS
jgi:hypothetical protein